MRAWASAEFLANQQFPPGPQRPTDRLSQATQLQGRPTSTPFTEDGIGLTRWPGLFFFFFWEDCPLFFSADIEHGQRLSKDNLKLIR